MAAIKRDLAQPTSELKIIGARPSFSPLAPISRNRAVVGSPMATIRPLLAAPVIIPGGIRLPLSMPFIPMQTVKIPLRLDILPLSQDGEDMSKQRILLINLYLNQIFNTIILNNTLKKKHEKNSTSKKKFVDLTIISRYKKDNKRYKPNHPFDFPDFTVKKIDDTTDKKIISKINSLLDQDKLISLTSCYDATRGGSGGLNKNKNIYPLRRRKQKTIKKKIRNIKNKNSLKYKIRNKINKCIKKCIKKNNIQQQKQQKQKENKVKIKNFLNSKIHEKINKFKLNKTKNYSKSKSNRSKYTRKNY
jgi:hypothetical protein